MRCPFRLLAAIPVLLCAACVSDTRSVTKNEITPRTYSDEGLALRRSIGKLRRVLLVPIRLEYQPLFLESVDRPALQRDIEGEIRGLLAEDLGYDLVRCSPPEGEVGRVVAWLDKAEPDEVPDPQTREILDAILDGCRADGILSIRLSVRSPRWTFLLTMATASLAWPTLFLEGKSSGQARLAGGTGDRMVWQSARCVNTGDDPRALARALLRDLEYAVPAVLAAEPTGPPAGVPIDRPAR